jgi:hypothetical protein
VNLGNEEMIEFGDKDKGSELMKVVGFLQVWGCVGSACESWVGLDNDWLSV